LCPQNTSSYKSRIICLFFSGFIGFPIQVTGLRSQVSGYRL
jgi:hypothetical protein